MAGRDVPFSELSKLFHIYMADKLIEKLGLIPYPGKPGYFYCETYQSLSAVKPLVDKKIEKRRAFSTIYLLLDINKYGIWHRLKSDETFFYHRGNSARIAIISSDGKKLDVVSVGDVLIEDGARYHHTVPANSWFNFQLNDGGSDDYGLFGIGVAPGFEIEDRIMKESKLLAEEFPQHKLAIEAFTATKK